MATSWMKLADPHEFLLRGTRRGPTPWYVSVGEFVPPAAAELMRNLFVEPRFTIRHAVERDLAPEPAIVEDLPCRGLDLSTLRLSIFMLGHGAPRRPRVLVPAPGLLTLRWGREMRGEPAEVCGTWARPLNKRHLNLLFGVLFDSTLPRRGRALDYVVVDSPLKELARLGWDLRTLDFRIRAKPESNALPSKT